MFRNPFFPQQPPGGLDEVCAFEPLLAHAQDRALPEEPSRVFFGGYFWIGGILKPLNPPREYDLRGEGRAPIEESSSRHRGIEIGAGLIRSAMEAAATV
jgi:hypothetical protein